MTRLRAYEILRRKCNIGQCVTVERRLKRSHRLAEHRGQFTAGGERSAVPRSKTFDEREVRLGQPYDLTDADCLEAAAEHQPARAALNCPQIAAAGQRIGDLVEMRLRNAEGASRLLKVNNRALLEAAYISIRSA
jgi:hypothetical protein